MRRRRAVENSIVGRSLRDTMKKSTAIVWLLAVVLAVVSVTNIEANPQVSLFPKSPIALNRIVLKYLLMVDIVL